MPLPGLGRGTVLDQGVELTHGADVSWVVHGVSPGEIFFLFRGELGVNFHQAVSVKKSAKHSKHSKILDLLEFFFVFFFPFCHDNYITIFLVNIWEYVFFPPNTKKEQINSKLRQLHLGVGSSSCVYSSKFFREMFVVPLRILDPPMEGFEPV